MQLDEKPYAGSVHHMRYELQLQTSLIEYIVQFLLTSLYHTISSLQFLTHPSQL